MTVAVIDSGICANHPDVAGHILAGWDFVENDAAPQDDFGHGCAVAGIIAANVDDGIGIAGVAPNAVILPLRVLDAQGIGTYSNEAAAIVYATDHGAQVINLSLGGATPLSVLEQAVNYAVGKGVTVVAAAGNTGGALLYPAAYGPVISVGSVDQNLQVSSFSSGGTNVDLRAPGRDIESLTRSGGYAIMSGTSFAAPQVAGVAVLEIARGHTLKLDGGIVSAGSGTTGSATAAALTCPTFPFTVPASDTASLINAIACANGNGAGSNDVINLTASTYTLTAVNNATDGGNGLPIIVSASSAGTLTINGSGATITRSSVGGTPNFRILEVASGGNLILNGVTLSNGSSGSNGAGLYNNRGTLVLNNSTISGNIGDGLSIYIGTATIANSTIAANLGRGIGIGGSTVTIVNSTSSGNTTRSFGGDLSITGVFDSVYTPSAVKVLNGTISGNTRLTAVVSTRNQASLLATASLPGIPPTHRTSTQQ